MDEMATVLTGPLKTTKLKVPVRASLTRAHLAAAARPAAREEGRVAAAAAAASLSTLLGCPIELTCALADATVDGRSTLSHHAVFAVLELTHVRSFVVLELDAIAAAALLARVSGTDADGPLTQLTRLDESALGWLCLATLASLRSSGLIERRFAPRLVSISADAHTVAKKLVGQPRHVTLSLGVRIAGIEGRARVVMPANALLIGLEQEPCAERDALAPEVGAARLPFDCIATTPLLDRADVDSLRVGDVVPLEAVRTAGPGLVGTLNLRGHHTAFSVAASEAGLTFLSLLPQPQGRAMKKPSSDLPVQLEVELTRLSLSLAELGALRLGGVVPLHIGPAQTLTLRIGDRAVAKAELVDIEGELGARVVTML